MISSRQRTFGLKNSRISMLNRTLATTNSQLLAHHLTSSKIFTQMPLTSSTNIKWWCNKNSKMSCNSKSHKAPAIWASQVSHRLTQLKDRVSLRVHPKSSSQALLSPWKAKRKQILRIHRHQVLQIWIIRRRLNHLKIWSRPCQSRKLCPSLHLLSVLLVSLVANGRLALSWSRKATQIPRKITKRLRNRRALPASKFHLKFKRKSRLPPRQNPNKSKNQMRKALKLSTRIRKSLKHGTASKMQVPYG